MNDSIYQEIEDNPRFQELVKKRSRFAWLLSLITLTMYVAFIFLLLSNHNGSVLRYIPARVSLVVFLWAWD